MKRWTVVALAVLLVFSTLLAACAPKEVVVTKEVEKVVTQVVTKEVEKVVTKEVTKVVVETPAAPKKSLSKVYRIGIFEEPKTMNYWSYLGPDNSVWTQYVLAGQAPALYTLSDQRFDFVPSLATAMPPVPKQEGKFWVVTVPMVKDAKWSDGQPITAKDVAFTVNTSLELNLGGNWTAIYRPDAIDHVEAVNDYTVKFYFKSKPGLAAWQYEAAQGPILPEHYWKDTVAKAKAFIKDLKKPELPKDLDCKAKDLKESDKKLCDAQKAYDDAYQNARKTLYEAKALGAPTGGAFVTDKYEPGAFVQRTASKNYYFKGAEIKEYSDGTWEQTLANGNKLQLYGKGTGKVALDFKDGPYVSNVILSQYGSQDAAFLALGSGNVDYVLNPLSVAHGLVEKAQKGGNVDMYTNPDNGLFYLAFNMRKEPFSDPAFRKAVDIILDKEFVANKILQGTVIPAYSVVPPGNAAWYNSNIKTPYVGMSRADRVKEAIKVLKDAGWKWTKEPAWNDKTQDVDPGEGLTMPNGKPCPQITILGPGPSYDPQRATFNQWISEWMRQMGMPTKSELTGFNAILGPVFINANFDMYILGWGLTIYPDYLCDFFEGKNGVITGGELQGYNTPGMNDEKYNALCDTFLAETDVVKAKQEALEMQQILSDQRPYIPLFYRQSIDLISKNVELPYYKVLGGISNYAGMQSYAKVYTMAK